MAGRQPEYALLLFGLIESERHVAFTTDGNDITSGGCLCKHERTFSCKLGWIWASP
jgi:hypothetical protein